MSSQDRYPDHLSSQHTHRGKETTRIMPLRMPWLRWLLRRIQHLKTVFTFAENHLQENDVDKFMWVLSLRSIAALIIGITLVSLASSWYEVQSEKEAHAAIPQYKADTF